MRPILSERAGRARRGHRQRPSASDSQHLSTAFARISAEGGSLRRGETDRCEEPGGFDFDENFGVVNVTRVKFGAGSYRMVAMSLS